ncbi:MAG: nucleotidyltransferase domain-containing protein [Candidatus Hadarchaeota archaeon]
MTVKRREEGSRSYPVYRSNRRSEKFRQLKALDMRHRIETCGLLDEIEKEAAPDCIVLFGSAARGEDVRESDVDLYVQSEEMELAFPEHEELLKRSIQLHFQPEFNSYPDELKNNIVNGTVLRGYLKAY